MNGSVDRPLVEQLLEDGSLSYNEVAKRAHCSAWSVRRIARELAGDTRPMKTRRRSRREADRNSAGDDASLAWWIVPLLAVGGIGLALFFRRGGGNQ